MMNLTPSLIFNVVMLQSLKSVDANVEVGCIENLSWLADVSIIRG